MPPPLRPWPRAPVWPKIQARSQRLLGVLAFAVGCISADASAPPAGTRLEGITEPVDDVLLSTAVAGTVAVVNVKEGSVIEKGAVLLELDKNRETLDVARKRIARDILHSELERTRQLFRSSSAVPKEELDKKEAEAAAAAVDLDLALELLRQKQVVSPITGVVVDLPFAVGEACQALQAVARVVDNSRVRFVTHVLPAEVGRIAVGQPAGLEIMGSDGKPVTLTGRVTFVSPVVDAASGLLRIAAEFENPSRTVRPGLSARLHVDHGR